MIGTLLLPVHVLIIPQYILFRTLRLGRRRLPYLPLLVPKFLATEAFFVFLMVQFMRGIPRELDEAARIDGAAPYRHLPARHPAAEPAGAGHHGDLLVHLDLERLLPPAGLPLRPGGLHGAGGADACSSTRPAQSAVGPMFAMSVLSLLPVFLFFLAFQRMLVEGINTSGLKG